MNQMRCTLDACALLAFLNDEEGADSIEELLIATHAGNASVSMSIINLLEVYYGEMRDKGEEIAKIVLDTVQHYSIKIVNEISGQAFHEAARLKATYRISLADSIGIAIANELASQYVTSDHHELEIIAKNEPIPFFWFR
ncbi:MAG: PIN domain-containing protein [Treponema sp.]|nr:PIN domain-containing protein [Treponema sp.]